MKTIQTICFITLMTISAHGQLASDRLFEDYYGKEGVTSYVINKSMFQLFATEGGSNEAQEFKDLVAQLDKIVIMSVESDTQKPSRATDFYKKTKNDIPKTYKQMMHVIRENEKVTIYLDEKKERVREVLMLIGEPDSTVLISISGDIDLEKLSELSEKMNISGFENLDMNKK